MQVLAFCGITLKSESDKFIFSCIKPNAFLIDSSKREAALPVGATNLMCNLQSNNSCRTSNKRVTVVVFPVPGPPVINRKWTFNRCRYRDFLPICFFLFFREIFI